MKSKSFILQILCALILTIFLSFSGNGQTIIVNNDYICFDTLAAKDALNELKLKDTLIVYQDSLISTMAAENAKLDISYAEMISWNDKLRTDNSNLTMDLYNEKKERKIWMRTALGMAGVFLLILTFK